MFNSKLNKCPVCGNKFELGFSSRSSPLSFITAAKMRKFVSRDEDLNQAGWKVILPAKASYDVAYHCRGCKFLIVDYSTKVSSKEAKGQAALLA